MPAGVVITEADANKLLGELQQSALDFLDRAKPLSPKELIQLRMKVLAVCLFIPPRFQWRFRFFADQLSRFREDIAWMKDPTSEKMATLQATVLAIQEKHAKLLMEYAELKTEVEILRAENETLRDNLKKTFRRTNA